MRRLAVLACVCAGVLLPFCMREASAGTMYKCVDRAGKIAYGNRPCPPDSGTAKTFEVADAPSAAVSAQADAERKARLQKLNDASSQRAAERERIASADSEARRLERAAESAGTAAQAGPALPLTPKEDEDMRKTVEALQCIERNGAGKC